MPIYAYRCTRCGHAKDVLQKVSDPLLTECPACGAATFVKQITAAGFQLKGSGWYVTDFRGGNNSAAKGAADASGTADGTSGGKPEDKADKSADKSADKASEKASPSKAEPAPAPAPSTAAPPSAAPSPGSGR